MLKIYRMLSRVRAWLLAPACPVDELVGLTARDFADLPTYHPTERQGDRGCAA